MTVHKLILVEDSEADARVVRRAVERENLDVDVVHLTSAEQAENFLYSNGNSNGAARRLVLLDLNLPGADGFTLLDNLKQNQDTSQLPVIVWSSSDQTTDVARAYKSGANCYLVKPMALREATSLIANVCRFWFNVATIA